MLHWKGKVLVQRMDFGSAKCFSPISTEAWWCNFGDQFGHYFRDHLRINVRSDMKCGEYLQQTRVISEVISEMMSEVAPPSFHKFLREALGKRNFSVHSMDCYSECSKFAMLLGSQVFFMSTKINFIIHFTIIKVIIHSGDLKLLMC